jgi:hypothetical protein
MKKLAILIGLALELAVCGCGNNVPSTITNTATSGNWEAQLINPIGGQASLSNFIVAFNVTNNGPLDITGFSFFNQGSCFTTGLNAQTETGNASFTTDTTGNVTGTLSLTVTSVADGTVLTLSGQLTGKSNGTTTTTGTLSNGVVVGNWTLNPGANASSCNAVTQGDGATFVMCQSAATCTTTPLAAEKAALATEQF